MQPQPEPVASVDQRILDAQKDLAKLMRQHGATQEQYVVQIHEIQMAALINSLLPSESPERIAFLEQFVAGMQAACAALQKPIIQLVK